MKRIYLSGKISGCEELAKIKFQQMEAFFSVCGTAHIIDGGMSKVFVVNPFNIKPDCENPKWIDYMVADINELATCDMIYMLKGWETSPGARIEHALAVGAGIEVYYE